MEDQSGRNRSRLWTCKAGPHNSFWARKKLRDVFIRESYTCCCWTPEKKESPNNHIEIQGHDMISCSPKGHTRTGLSKSVRNHFICSSRFNGICCSPKVSTEDSSSIPNRHLRHESRSSIRCCFNNRTRKVISEAFRAVTEMSWYLLLEYSRRSLYGH